MYGKNQYVIYLYLFEISYHVKPSLPSLLKIAKILAVILGYTARLNFAGFGQFRPKTINIPILGYRKPFNSLRFVLMRIVFSVFLVALK